MITIQRVRVRWGAAARGAPQAAARRGLCRPMVLPPSVAILPTPVPRDAVTIHDVLAEEATGYERRDSLVSGGLDRARDLGLWLSTEGSALIVDRLPGRAAYPRDSGPARLFTLAPGEIGAYRANFRFTFTTCACDPSWYYENWLVLVGHGEMTTDAFVSHEPDHEVDHRVHLYGGSRRPGRR